MRLISTLFLITFLSSSGHTQESLKIDSLKLVVDVTINNDIVYIHRLQEKETLYSLSRFFSVPVQDLMQLNNIKPGQTISVGSDIKVPVKADKINTVVSKPGPDWIPVLYLVKRRETLFKISHIYFPQSIQDLINRNSISSFSLNEDQELTIGWWPIHSRYKKKENKDITNQEILNKILDDLESLINSDNEILLDSILAEDQDSSQYMPILGDSIMIPDSIAFTSRKGIAFWNKEGSDFENLFVMHDEARENSYIKLRNPINGKEVVAKVIMPIPSQIYTDDIDIVITPAVANNLGALDSRFRIEMDYYE